ncbi:hypothetical protein SL053_002356 [Flavobacterium psychrophilum]|nr:hypothetical protein [Flavobacterium psychrophilum]
MGKYTYVGGDYLENIGGNKIVYVLGDNEVNSNKQIIQKADGGIFYEEPKDAPEKKVEEDKQQPITPVTKMALISPIKDFKGEFGIDWCEKDDNFDKILSFQNTKVTDIEYVFDESTKQFKKATAADDDLKQILVKKMYLPINYTDGSLTKEYITTWMNIAKDQIAKINLTTWFIDKAKKADSEKEFITFKTNENFEITYDKKLNENIRIKVESHKKVSKNIEIKAIKTFETNQIISIVDEAGNPVGQIEMMANNQETLEIKIIPVVLKTNEAEQNTKAEEIYNKAIAAKNSDNKNLNDTLNKVSLNQAGIKSTIIANPSGAEKLVIDITKEYKNYWNGTKNKLKDWTFSATEKTESDETKRIPIWIDEDSNKNYEYAKYDGDINQSIGADKDILLDQLERDYLKKYPNIFNGAIIFVTQENYVDDKNNEKVGGYSQMIPLKSQGTIIFGSNKEDVDSYIHELGHMLGLQHTFIEDKNDLNNDITKNSKKIDIIEKRKTNKEKDIKEEEDYINDQQKQIDELNGKILKSKNKNDIKDFQELIQGKQGNIKSTKEQIEAYNDDIKKIDLDLEVANYKLTIVSGLNFSINKGKTLNYMDYENAKKSLLKKQCLVIKKDIKLYL